MIKQLSTQNEVVNVYLYKNTNINYLMLAIPDIFWSLEVSLDMNLNEIEEELVMYIFNFKDEEEATRIASILINWIAEYLKETNK
ncbi:YueH family protein [Staphylococcus devriesei]|nr:YueH family protein [Staphylococcus devriesei]